MKKKIDKLLVKNYKLKEKYCTKEPIRENLEGYICKGCPLGTHFRAGEPCAEDKQDFYKASNINEYLANRGSAEEPFLTHFTPEDLESALEANRQQVIKEIKEKIKKMRQKPCRKFGKFSITFPEMYGYNACIKDILELLKDK